MIFSLTIYAMVWSGLGRGGGGRVEANANEEGGHVQGPDQVACSAVSRGTVDGIDPLPRDGTG